MTCRSHEPGPLPGARPPVVLALVAVLLLATAWVAVPGVSATVPMSDTPTTYRDFSYGSVRTGNASEDKPQSKLWWHDGSWWSLLVSPQHASVQVFELQDDHTWRSTGVVVDDRADSSADALWDGARLYVASRQASSPLRVLRLSYDTAARRFTVDPGFPVAVNTGGSESATIAKDSTGRLWTTWTRARQVWVAHSTTDDSTWARPFVPAVGDTSVTSDDLSAVVAFGGRIGVMWSNQISGAFRFAVHADGQPATEWTLETALSGVGWADDHINLRTLTGDASGRLHAAVKTGLGDVAGARPTDPIVLVLTRAPAGGWTSAVVATVADRWTKPALALDETNAELYVVANSGTRIMHKRSALADIRFVTGPGAPLLARSGIFLNDPSTSKSPVTAASGLVVLASSTTDQSYYHGELAVRSAVTPTTPPPSPTPSPSPSPTPSPSPSPSPSATPSEPAQSPVPDGIVFRAAAGGANATGRAVSLAHPAGVRAGDLLLASLDARGAPGVTAPAGWTLVRADQDGTTMLKQTWVRTATAAEPPSWTWTFTRDTAASGTVQAYVGADPVLPVAAAAGQVNPRGTVVTAPAVTAPAGAVVVALLGHAYTATFAPPTGFDERVEAAGGSTYRVSSTSADRRWPTAGSTGPLTATASVASTSIGHTVALRPAG